MRKPFQSVLSKMVLSYLAVVLVIALLLSSFFYLFFARQYSEEIRINNEMMLNNTVNQIESSVIQRVHQIYLSLALGSPVNIHMDTLNGNHSKVVDIQQLLNNQVHNHSDLIHAIHLYDAENRFIISSAHGLLLEDRISSAAGTSVASVVGASSVDASNIDASRVDVSGTGVSGLVTSDADSMHAWITAMQDREESSLWLQTRLVPQDPYLQLTKQSSMIPLMTYVRSYPFQAAGRDSELLLAIDVKEAAISEIIETMIPASYNHTFIVDQHGIVISAADKSLLGKPAQDPSLIQSLHSHTSSDGSLTNTFDYDEYVVSHNQIAGNGWSIYTTTPTHSFYYKLDGLKDGVIILCLLAVAVGIAMSFAFSAAGYSPLKRILNTIKSRHGSSVSLKQNEYRFIDTAINSLTNQVDSLEETLQANQKVIKHNIILNMLNNRYTSDELTEQLHSIQVEMDYSRFQCMLIDPVSEGWKELQPKQLQHMTYSIIQQLESLDFEETQLLAEELQDHKIVVILCTNKTDNSFSKQIADFILSEVKSRFGLELGLSLGSWAEQPTEIHTSYREAKTLIRYSYFFPEQPILCDLKLLSRESSSLELSDSYLASFEKKLQARDLTGTVQAIEDLMLELKDGLYSAEYSHILLLKMVSIYSDCISGVRWQPAEASSLDLYKQYRSIYHIDRYSEWMINLVTEFIHHMEKRSQVRSVDTITAVKAYIRDNLSGDLTLDHVSEQVFISPKYLSKIFKEETGVSYSDYVTNQRMERARELMSERELTIEQVASTVGYSTSAYFIKRFKEIHGCTPKSFMRGLMN